MTSTKNNKSMRFVILLLLLSFSISGLGCIYPWPLIFWPKPKPGSFISFQAGIQPLPENHGSWSKEEVDAVIEAVVTTAEGYGLKKEWDPGQGSTLSSGHFRLSINAIFAYDEDGSRERARRMDPLYSGPSGRHTSLSLLRRPKNILKEKGTILIYIYYTPFQPPITDSERLFVEKIWHEVLDPLRNKFGERIEEGKPIKIYKLED